MNTMLEVFGIHYFSELELKSRVPSSIFKKFKSVQLGEAEMSLEVADIIASAVKSWATEKGATHFTHWFQPLTELTAEKHESFISITSDGSIMSQFSGKDLIKGKLIHLHSQMVDLDLLSKHVDILLGIQALLCF